MKKVFFILLILFFSNFLISCNRIKEYGGKVIVKLTYQTVDYNGGYTTNVVLDFINNKYLSSGILPGEEQEPNLEVKRTFSEEEEKDFINGCYSYGLFNLKDKYKRTGIIDGGGWTLLIEYEDGSIKESTGINASPTTIFNNCSTYFYDICGERILGNLPDYYFYPPGVSIAFRYKIGEYGSGSDNSIARVSRANFKWKRFESLDNDLFEINNSLSDKNQFLINNNYQLVLYTANYNCKDRFTKIKITSYDFDENLTNEKEVYHGSWFKQIELDLELEKIYKFELGFYDGDYVEYTFNTKSLNSKVLYGEYWYNIYTEGKSVLKINNDDTYELKQFEFFDNSKNINNTIINGKYQFEVINDKEYLCLYLEDETRIVLEYYPKTLFINFELSTFDLSSYHLESKPEHMNGRVDFRFWN